MNRDFRLLWAGESVSALGTQFSTLALPTLAILRLHAGPLGVGVLTGAGFAGYPAVGLLAAPVIDRLPKRRVLLAANAVRAAVLGAVAAAALTGAANLPELVFAALLVSGASAAFDSAYQVTVASMVPAGRLLGANARLETSQSIAYFAGPGAAGYVTQALGAGAAVAADAASYLVSFAAALAIRTPALPTPGGRPSFLRDLAGGFRIFRRYGYLAWVAGCVSVSNAGNMMVRSLLLLVAYRAFHLSPAAAGWILAAAGLAGVAGATTAGRISRRIGLGPALTLATFVEGFAWCAVPLALLGAPLAVLLGAALVSGFMTPLWNVSVVTLRQTAVPLDLQARVVAVSRAAGVGAIPAGTVLGGALAALLTAHLGTELGLVTSVGLGGAVAASSALVLLAGRVTAIRCAEDVAAAA